MGVAIFYLILVAGAGALGWKYGRFSPVSLVVIGIVAAVCGISFGYTGTRWNAIFSFVLALFMISAFGLGLLAKRYSLPR